MNRNRQDYGHHDKMSRIKTNNNMKYAKTTRRNRYLEHTVDVLFRFPLK